MLVPSSCGARSSSFRSERKLLDDAGCWSCICRIGLLRPDDLVNVMMMVQLSQTRFKLMDVCSCGCGGSSLIVDIVNVVDKAGLVGVNISAGVCDTGVIVFWSVAIRDKINKTEQRII